jgi:cystathionine beta-lyase/cystathionine gamma-synthase
MMLPSPKTCQVRYTRCNNNPSQVSLGQQLAALEGAEAALPLSAGMAAISTTLLHLLEPGAHVIAVRGPYGGGRQGATAATCTGPAPG